MLPEMVPAGSCPALPACAGLRRASRQSAGRPPHRGGKRGDALAFRALGTLEAGESFGPPPPPEAHRKVQMMDAADSETVARDVLAASWRSPMGSAAQRRAQRRALGSATRVSVVAASRRAERGRDSPRRAGSRPHFSVLCRSPQCAALSCMMRVEPASRTDGSDPLSKCRKRSVGVCSAQLGANGEASSRERVEAAGPRLWRLPR